MAKTPTTGVRFDPDVRAALERVAAEDARSLSSLIHKIVAEWLREHGHMDAVAKRRTPRPRPGAGKETKRGE